MSDNATTFGDSVVCCNVSFPLLVRTRELVTVLLLLRMNHVEQAGGRENELSSG